MRFSRLSWSDIAMQSDDKKTVTRSRFLSLILRHSPETIGVQLDENGWVDVDVLLARLAENDRPTSLAQLIQIVDTNDKKRFAFSPDGLKIRASQGHSVAVELNLNALIPPSVLFYGTASRFVNRIFMDGLKKMNRQHVHLSATSEIAVNVGSRHGKPVVLKVDCLAMVEDGYEFYQSANGVWLTESVPVAYLSRTG